MTSVFSVTFLVYPKSEIAIRPIFILELKKTNILQYQVEKKASSEEESSEEESDDEDAKKKAAAAKPAEKKVFSQNVIEEFSAYRLFPTSNSPSSSSVNFFW